ncbi:MAG TPA: hypothetical protein EYN89_04835 [Flavobacteriales bacterium]|nr:hypothetical protein [Flavobacteriales bacterium]
MTSIVLSLILMTTNLLHVGQVAEYYFSLHEDQLQMKFVIEKDELFNFEFEGDCNFQKTTSLCLANYIKSNSTVKMNGEKINFDLGDSYTDHGHLILYFKAELKNVEIQSISIQNQCFFEFDSDYKNRIILDLDKFHKSYLLTKGKDSIHLK